MKKSKIMSDEARQKLLVDKILLASSIIEMNRSSGGNMMFSNKWVIDNILGTKNVLRKHKIKKILDDKAGEI